MNVFKIILLLLFAVNISVITAQNNLPRLSPKSFVGQTVGYTNITITYGSPGINEREVWGKLVPYGEVWRTGANEATTIEFDNDLIIEGKKVPSGKYALFTIPNKKEWIIILNKIYDQWGAFKYNKEEDQIRFKVKPISNHHVERLKFSFEYKEPYKAVVNLEWGNLRIPIIINSENK